MRNLPAYLVALTLPLGLLACGGDDAASTASSTSAGSSTSSGSGGGGGGGGSGGEGAGGPVISYACPGSALASGPNSLAVGGGNRDIFIDLPGDLETPAGVVFAWHGYGDSATNFQAALGLNPNAIAGVPLIIVYPQDSGLFPPKGLDWAIFQGAIGQPNADADVFVATLGCLVEQYKVDPKRVYSLGFSAGAIMTNLLHSRYPDVLAATLAYSGAWFNDPAETAGVNTAGLSVEFDWSPLDHDQGGNLLMTHGGDNDEFSFGTTKIIDFEDAAQAAIPFLAEGGRVVVECVHAAGHQPHPNVGADLALRYLTDHQFGQKSPYLTAGLTGYPDSCSLHPAP